MSTIAEIESYIGSLTHAQYMDVIENAPTAEHKALIRELRWRSEFNQNPLLLGVAPGNGNGPVASDYTIFGVVSKGDDGPIAPEAHLLNEAQIWGKE